MHRAHRRATHITQQWASAAERNELGCPSRRTTRIGVAQRQSRTKLLGARSELREHLAPTERPQRVHADASETPQSSHTRPAGKDGKPQRRRRDDSAMGYGSGRGDQRGPHQCGNEWNDE
jgi:hypothetical protein